MRKHHHSAFTLVELLVISAIFILLTGLLVRTAHKVQVAADQTTCINSLKIALQNWKKGGTPADLDGNSPAITMRDKDWKAGCSLLDYQIGDCTEQGTSLRCPVRLRLRGPQGQAISKSVTYRVLTGPERIIFREALP
jgi:hypothetical protein